MKMQRKKKIIFRLRMVERKNEIDYFILTFDGFQDGRTIFSAHGVRIDRFKATAGRGTISFLAYEQCVMIIEHVKNWMHTVNNILILWGHSR